MGVLVVLNGIFSKSLLAIFWIMWSLACLVRVLGVETATRPLRLRSGARPLKLMYVYLCMCIYIGTYIYNKYL